MKRITKLQRLTLFEMLRAGATHRGAGLSPQHDEVPSSTVTSLVRRGLVRGSIRWGDRFREYWLTETGLNLV